MRHDPASPLLLRPWRISSNLRGWPAHPQLEALTDQSSPQAMRAHGLTGGTGVRGFTIPDINHDGGADHMRAVMLLSAPSLRAYPGQSETTPSALAREPGVNWRRIMFCG